MKGEPSEVSHALRRRHHALVSVELTPKVTALFAGLVAHQLVQRALLLLLDLGESCSRAAFSVRERVHVALRLLREVAIDTKRQVGRIQLVRRAHCQVGYVVFFLPLESTL